MHITKKGVSLEFDVITYMMELYGSNDRKVVSIKLVTESLCRRDINLLPADIVIHTLLKHVSTLHSSVGRSLLETLKNRMKDR